MQYFYTKTRNYRILFGALRQGARDGLRLGAATALYVLVEEGVVKLRHAAGYGVTAESPAVDAPLRKGKEPARVDFQATEFEAEDDQASRSRLAQVIRIMADRTEDGYQWLDGGVAGTALGLVVGVWSESWRIAPISEADLRRVIPDSSVTDRFPIPLLLRTMVMGTTLGAFEGGLRIVQAKVGALKRDEEIKRRELDKQAAALEGAQEVPT